MTIKEFNERYSITVIVMADQYAELYEGNDPNEEFIEYGAVDEIIKNITYKVYDKEAVAQVFEVETEDDDTFLAELKDHFNIVDLT